MDTKFGWVIAIWDPQTGEKVRTLAGHLGGESSICAFASRGRMLLASAEGKTVRIWDPHADVPMQKRAATGSVSGLSGFPSADQAFLASAGTDKAVRVWD